VTPQIIGQSDPDSAAGTLPDGAAAPAREDKPVQPDAPVVEIGGRKGPDPTRHGDWEKNGRCIDF
jgi:hypothetical protein